MSYSEEVEDRPSTVAEWDKAIMKCYERNYRMFEEEGTIRKMSRAVATFQTLRAYGGYYWRVRQHLATSKQMADNDSSLGKRLPKKTLVLNPNGKPDDEYWMCVHDTCLKFINATPIDKKYDINATNVADLNDSQAIEKLENKKKKRYVPDSQWKFYYGSQHIWRLLKWGAKQNILEIIVQCSDKNDTDDGFIPMYLALESPVAVDIAYLIHRVTSDSCTFNPTNRDGEEGNGEGAGSSASNQKGGNGTGSSGLGVPTQSLKGTGIGVTPTPSTQNSPAMAPKKG